MNSGRCAKTVSTTPGGGLCIIKLQKRTFGTLMLVVKALEDSAFLAHLQQHVRPLGQIVHLSS